MFYDILFYYFLLSTVMVGFPGETAEDYEELYKFVEKTKFDKMGAFNFWCLHIASTYVILFIKSIIFY